MAMAWLYVEMIWKKLQSLQVYLRQTLSYWRKDSWILSFFEYVLPRVHRTVESRLYILLRSCVHRCARRSGTVCHYSSCKTTSSLIMCISMSHPALAFDKKYQDCEVPERIAIWARWRYTTDELEQSLPVLFLIFQARYIKACRGNLGQNSDAKHLAELHLLEVGCGPEHQTQGQSAVRNKEPTLLVLNYT